MTEIFIKMHSARESIIMFLEDHVLIIIYLQFIITVAIIKSQSKKTKNYFIERLSRFSDSIEFELDNLSSRIDDGSNIYFNE